MVTRAQLVATAVGALRERLADDIKAGDVEVSSVTHRAPAIAAVGGAPRLYVTVEIVVDAPDAEVAS